MCDYSLHNVKTRDAAHGDKLVSCQFRTTATRGFCAVDDPDVAVCLKPGTELALTVPVRERRYVPYWFPLFKMTIVHHHTIATFRKINEGIYGVHHDALEFVEFSRRKYVMLNNLEPGQHCRVLQLPAEPVPVAREPSCVIEEVMFDDRALRPVG